MGSKAFLLLGLLFAIVLVISSDVAARELAEDSTNEKGCYDFIIYNIDIYI